MRALTLAALIAMLAIGPTVAYAGTTGSLSGTVLNAVSGAPMADVRVIATSGAQVEATRTDARGNFSFASLTPDIYAVTAEREGFQLVAYANIPIFADASVRLPISLAPVVMRILHHIDGTSGSLIKHGTVSDIYSYNNPWLSLFPPVQSDYAVLRMTPGITFGAGAPVTH